MPEDGLRIQNEEVKLIKCPACGTAFYISTKEKGDFEERCPYCEKKVKVHINGDVKIQNDNLVE